jgi:hypothetical protein
MTSHKAATLTTMQMKPIRYRFLAKLDLAFVKAAAEPSGARSQSTNPHARGKATF